ncbi:MAG: FAD-dependent oxidoreductase [Verrucomicrobia bacterium]|nr:FAD-dependent oxidoreductase [Verrucomicrobiota bacterium]
MNQAKSKPKKDHYDVVIIGAGMSGMAAAIRLAHFGKDVCLLERHNAVGGLNSFYSIGGRKYDVGLHALTNYVPPGVKGTPLVKILRQLRIARDELDLNPQRCSRIAFPGVDLKFSNDFTLLESEILREFPDQADGLQTLLRKIREWDDNQLDYPDVSAREIVGECLSNPDLVEMLFCPLMFYGNAREHDMEFGQYVILFKSLFFEGFARPFDGIRVMLRVVRNKLKESGVERCMKLGVKLIQAEQGRVAALELDNGRVITADKVISCAGWPETLSLCSDVETKENPSNVGRLSFVETINILQRQPREFGLEDTIVFFNDAERFEFARPDELVDVRSGVICIPNNYDYSEGRQLEEGIIRFTAQANFEKWNSLNEEDYVDQKSWWFKALGESACKFLPIDSFDVIQQQTMVTDMFTPKTVKKFTGRLAGAVYGSPIKNKPGKTHLENLYICGTDQGFLGIVGAMLSGITIANLYGLRGD